MRRVGLIFAALLGSLFAADAQTYSQPPLYPAGYTFTYVSVPGGASVATALRNASPSPNNMIVIAAGVIAATVAESSGSGVFTCPVATGAGSEISVPTLYADTTYGGFSVQVTPPNTDTWHWSADLTYDRLQ